MKDAISNPTEAKTLSLEEALEMAAKMNIALFPIRVYKDKEDWGAMYSEHLTVWWCALPSCGHVFLPIQEYESEHGKYITTFDENLYTTQLAETIPEAVMLAAAHIEKADRRWNEEQTRRAQAWANSSS
jgi:hypothetical protein